MRRLFVALTSFCAAAAAFGGFLKILDGPDQRGLAMALFAIAGACSFGGIGVIVGRPVAAAGCGTVTAALVFAFFWCLGHAVI